MHAKEEESVSDLIQGLVSLHQLLGQSQQSEYAGSLSPLINEMKLPHADMEFRDASNSISKQGPQASPTDIQVRHQE